MTEALLERNCALSDPARALKFSGDAPCLASEPPVDSPATAAGNITMWAIPAEGWDNIACGFDGISQEQTFDFGRLRWPSTKQEARLFKLDGAIIGGVLVRIQSLPFKLSSLAICKWGPIHFDQQHAQRNVHSARMIDLLIEEYAAKRGMMLSLMPRADAGGGDREYRALLQRGFRAGAQVPYPSRYLVDLRLPDKEHRLRLHHKWRYHLARSEKVGLSFEHAGADRLGDFQQLYESMTDRKKFPDHSAYETLPELLASTTAALRPELFFVRSREGALVAGAIIFSAGATASYLYGATNAEALSLRAGYFMHWKIVQWLKERSRATHYDLGGSDGFNGLHQFKSGFVGDAGAINDLPPMMNFAARPMPMLLGSSALAVREIWRAVMQALKSIRSGEARPDLNKPKALLSS